MNYPFLTQKERDVETGLDYFLARYYSSIQGRFTSPDEFKGGPHDLSYDAETAVNPTFYADVFAPQSFNKYQYCYNNPLRFVDPDGHQAEAAAAVLRGVGAVTETVPGGQAVGAVLIGLGYAIVYHKEILDGNAQYGRKNPTCPAISDGCAMQGDSVLFSKSTQQQSQAPPQEQRSQEGQSTNYQPNPKHDGPKGDDRRGVSPQPKAGGSLYDSATEVKPGQRVAVDRSSAKFVVYRTDPNGQTHGYETTWKGLRNDQRAALQKAGLVTKHGRIKEPQ